MCGTILLYFMGFLFEKPKTYRKLKTVKNTPVENLEAKFKEMCADSDFKHDIDQLTSQYFDSIVGYIVMKLQGEYDINSRSLLKFWFATLLMQHRSHDQ